MTDTTDRVYVVPAEGATVYDDRHRRIPPEGAWVRQGQIIARYLRAGDLRITEPPERQTGGEA